MFEIIRGHTIYAPPLNFDSVVLDLGANRGEFAKQMSASHGGTYYLVEANPVLAEALRVEGRFPVWQCAVAAMEGPIHFNIACNDEGSSILNLPVESALNCVLRETVEVPARKLESLLAEIRGSRIDLLKMDIEGAEVMVLRSLSHTTLRTIGQITVEFHSDPVFGFDLRRDVEGVIRDLRRRGFLCIDFSEPGQPRRDVLFVNRALHRISWLQRVRWCPPSWLSKIWNRVPPFVRGRLRRWIDAATGTVPASRS